MSIEIKQLIIRTSVKASVDDTPGTISAQSAAELDAKLEQLRFDLSLQLRRELERYMRKAMEP